MNMKSRTIASTLMAAALFSLSACADTVSPGSGQSDQSLVPTGDPSLCLTGPITTLVQTGAPVDLILDDDNVYWIDLPGVREEHDSDVWHLMRTPKGGGATVVLTKGLSFYEVVAAGPNLYWVGTNSGAPTTFSLFSIPKSGGAVTTLTPVGVDTRFVGVDGSLAYFANKYAGTLSSMSTSGGPQTVIASALSLGDPALGDTVLMDAQNFYWSSDNEVFRLPKTGGAPTILTSQLDAGYLSVQDAQNLYFSSNAPSNQPDKINTIAVPKTGGNPTVIHDGVNPSAVDDRCFYESPYKGGVADEPSHLVVGSPKNGGAPALMASGMTTISAMTADATGLYWTDTWSGRIMKMAR
jgi:hypothetical protein